MDTLGRMESGMAIFRRGGVREVTPTVRVFRVRGDADKTYIVRNDKDTGTWTCHIEDNGKLCPDFKHNLHEAGSCKHIIAAKIEGGVI